MSNTTSAMGPQVSEPQVSIIVPFYNSSATLAACIESLLAQETGVAYEILLVDNRSSDDSAAIVARYDGVTLLHESTPGAYAARNTGIQQAQASVIAFTDADCTPDPDWLSTILDGLSDPNVAVLLGHCRYPDDASLTLRLLAAYENAKTAYVLGHRDPAYRFAYCNNMAVRASVFAELGPFLTWQRAADSELVHRLATRSPELRTVYRPAMRINHLEFRRFRDRARRLQLYTDTNSKIATFRELSLDQRLAVLAHAVFGR